MSRKFRAWLLPLVFLAGYLLAWGSIIVDRQMVIAEQRELKRELERTKKELRLAELVQELEFTRQEMIFWNKAALLKPPEKEKENGRSKTK